jgi:hypothetical protein
MDAIAQFPEPSEEFLYNTSLSKFSKKGVVEDPVDGVRYKRLFVEAGINVNNSPTNKDLFGFTAVLGNTFVYFNNDIDEKTFFENSAMSWRKKDADGITWGFVCWDFDDVVYHHTGDELFNNIQVHSKPPAETQVGNAYKIEL